MIALLTPAIQGPLTERGMRPDVGHLDQPICHPAVGGGTVQQQPGALQARLKRIVETLPQIAVEALHLALGARPVWSAQPNPESRIVGQLQQASMVAVLASGVGITLQHHGLHVIEQDLSGNAAEVIEGQQQRIPHRLERLIRHKPDEGHAAIAQRGNERRHRRLAAAEDHKIRLHLLTRLRLEANCGAFIRLGGLERAQPSPQLGRAALVALSADLPQQNGGGQPARVTWPNGSLHPS